MSSWLTRLGITDTNLHGKLKAIDGKLRLNWEWLKDKLSYYKLGNVPDKTLDLEIPIVKLMNSYLSPCLKSDFFPLCAYQNLDRAHVGSMVP